MIWTQGGDIIEYCRRYFVEFLFVYYGAGYIKSVRVFDAVVQCCCCFIVCMKVITIDALCSIDCDVLHSMC